MKERTSGLVLGFVALLAAVLTLRGVEWYNAHLDAVQNGPEVALPSPKARPRPPASPAASPGATPYPQPLGEELADLLSPEPARQSRAITALAEREVTPELVAAVQGARPANEYLADRLVCLEARLPGPAAIERGIARLSKEDPTWAGEMDIALCLLAALGNRMEEQPARIRDALIPFAMSYPGRPRELALRALGRLRESEMPPKLREAFDNSVHPSFPVRAALAMKLDETQPHLVGQWLSDPETSVRSTMRGHLVRSPRPEAGRQLAQAAVERIGDREYLDALRKREELHWDATTALVEIALDETSPYRLPAVEWIGAMGDAGAIPYLRQLQASGTEELRAYAEAALARLERRHRGRAPRMKPPRSSQDAPR